MIPRGEGSGRKVRQIAAIWWTILWTSTFGDADVLGGFMPTATGRRLLLSRYIEGRLKILDLLESVEEFAFLPRLYATRLVLIGSGFGATCRCMAVL